MALDDLVDRVDRYWAKALGFPTSERLRAGVHVVTDAPVLGGYCGIYVLRLHAACVVAVPATLRDDATRVTAGRDAEEVFNRTFAASIAPSASGEVLGPSWHGYLLPHDVRISSGRADLRPRPLGRTDDRSLEQLRATVGEDDWAEGGFLPRPQVLWGIDDGDGLACAGNMTDFDGSPADVGLVTRPNVRGQGMASTLAAAMCAAAGAAESPTTPLLRYRALATNLASLRVADRLGFRGVGANIAVRLV